MRPRVFAAEDYPFRFQRPWRFRASMRPRVFAAEDRIRTAVDCWRRPSFNEAAGIRRGRLQLLTQIRVANTTLQ